MAKKAFEETARQHGVEITAYHADNGIFRANKWVEECQGSRQRLTFAGVNAHHTNGLAERRIRSLHSQDRYIASISWSPNQATRDRRRRQVLENDHGMVISWYSRLSKEGVYEYAGVREPYVQTQSSHLRVTKFPTYELLSSWRDLNSY
jgi:hypothetical protein